ncbi:hypothetical protein BC939DRAFT_442383, partial [Gamsiella multidivaricata]|uniref:uncharacterized protein n=1 Tax=Gamsiella multidivaricata TaxID=101098 RepID=UPI002220416C
MRIMHLSGKSSRYIAKKLSLNHRIVGANIKKFRENDSMESKASPGRSGKLSEGAERATYRSALKDRSATLNDMI